MKKHAHTNWLLPVLSSLILASCAGGGGSITAVENESLDSPLTTNPCAQNALCAEPLEYEQQEGLDLINARNAHERGSTGLNIRIGVVDTGIDGNHPEFSQTVIGGKSFGGSATGFDSDASGHGTHVASIIGARANNAGIVGVAPKAELFSYRVDDNIPDRFLPGLNDFPEVLAQQTADNIHISNNSWGVGERITDYNRSEADSIFGSSVQALSNAQQQGTIFVFASGNNGNGRSQGASQVNFVGGLPLLYPELKPTWLVVTAIDNDGVEPLYADRCGLAADFCVTAPGGGTNTLSNPEAGINGAEANGTYIRYSGTSMATAHVSGVLALVKQTFPTLKPDEVVTRVKTTASLETIVGYDGQTLAQDGEAVMRSIFGHGLVDADAATKPIGALMFATEQTNDMARNAPIDEVNISLPSSIAAPAYSALANVQIAVFDAFDGATFKVPAAQLLQTQNNRDTIALPTWTDTKADVSPHNVMFKTDHKITKSHNGIHIVATTSPTIDATLIDTTGISGLLTKPSFLQDTTSWHHTLTFDSGSSWHFAPSVQLYPTGDSQHIGFSFGARWKPSDQLSIFAKWAQQKIPSHLGILSANNTMLDSMTVHTGLTLKLSETWQFFTKARLLDLSSKDTSHWQWKLSQARNLSAAAGFRYEHKQYGFMGGISLPDQWISGSSSINLPAGRTSSGRVFYQKIDIPLRDKLSHGTFAGAYWVLSQGERQSWRLQAHVTHEERPQGHQVKGIMGLQARF